MININCNNIISRDRTIMKSCSRAAKEGQSRVKTKQALTMQWTDVIDKQTTATSFSMQSAMFSLSHCTLIIHLILDHIIIIVIVMMVQHKLFLYLITNKQMSGKFNSNELNMVCTGWLNYFLHVHIYLLVCVLI